MTVRLAPFANEALFRDPALAGEWSDALAGLFDIVHTPPWCSYVARRDEDVVGLGALIGPPGPREYAEIAYFTLGPHRNAGVAFAIADALLALARRQELAGVQAHTLPRENSSTRILRNLGFALVETNAHDPDTGQVWRWERQLSEAA